MANGNTFQLFQLENNEQNQPYIFQPYSEVIRLNHPVRQEDYRLVYKGIQHGGDTAETIMSRLAEKNLNTGKARAISRSDVIVVAEGSAYGCYYYDDPICIPIEGFLKGTTSENGGITSATRDYALSGKDGLWQVVDTIKVEGTMFFLMEKQDSSQPSAGIVVNRDGKVVCDDCQNRFAEPVMTTIKHFLHPEQPLIAVEHPRPPREKLVNYQKFYENGEYLRSASSEVTEEQNYNMIDGIGNNKKPKKRRSVRQRLREKQQLLHGGVEKQNILEKT